MKKITTPLSYLCVLFTFVAVFGMSVFAQKFEKRSVKPVEPKAPVSAPIASNDRIQRGPFDFSDKNYEMNGVKADYILDRVNGADSKSVFDYNEDWMYSNVRVIATKPVYGNKGAIHFVNQFGSLSEFSFTDDKTGGNALEIAYQYPIYVFPSADYSGHERQAAMMETGDDVEAVNPRGIRLVLDVVFTFEDMSESDHMFIKAMTEQNGESLDSTPIIKDTSDLMDFLYRGLVTIRTREIGAKFMVVPVLSDPTNGAIAPDAYLDIVRQMNGKPLPDEVVFQDTFECLQITGGYCTSN